MLIVRNRTARVHFLARILMIGSLLLGQIAPPIVWANPTGEDVVAGQAGFDRSGSTLTVTQGSQNAIINWQDFSIGADEITRFLQPNDLSSVLNRVITNNPSYIYGLLEANGNVLLINQSGILMGAGARIDTNGFLASTLDVSDSAFMAGGDLTFIGDSQAAIQNLGTIHVNGGDIYLIAQQIDNSGTLEAADGTVGLLAGAEVLLKAEGEDRGSVLVGSTGPVQDGAAISNSGEVKAAMATMEATGSMYSVAVNNEGVVRATGADTSGGRVRLTAGGADIDNSGTIAATQGNGDGGTIQIDAGSNADSTATVISSGTLDASGDGAGATGGRVEVTGDRVGLIGNAVVDVSGDAGGGEAYIGGGWQGKDPEIRNARYTHVGSDVEINADAGTSGDGGTVVAWSDDTTRFHGDVNARGGSTSGDGGDVEVSGKQTLDFTGSVVTTSANGEKGTLLLDPNDIVIADGAGAADDAEIADGEILFADGGAVTFTISEQAIEALVAGTDIILQANNTINMDTLTDGALTLTNNSNLTMTTTTGSITFDDTTDSIVASGTGTITINAGTTATLGGLTTAGGAIDITTGAGSLLTLAGAIASGGGMVTVSAGDLDLTGTINAGAGNISITQNNAGTIGLGEDNVFTGNLHIFGAELQNITTTGTLNLISTAGGTAIHVDGITAANSNNVGTVNLDASGGTLADIVFADTASTFNAITGTASDEIGVDIGLTTDTGGVSLTAQGAVSNPALDIQAVVTSAGPVLLRADTINLAALGDAIDAAGQTVTLRPNDNAVNIDVGTGTDVAGATLGISAAELNEITATTIVIGNTTNTGGIEVTAAINPDASANLQLTTDGNILLSQAVDTVTGVAGDLRLTSGANGTASTTTQAATGGITAVGLATAGFGSVDLTTNAATNTFDEFASSSSNSVDITEADGFDINAVGAITSITMAGFDLSLTATTGNITQTAVANTAALTLDADAITFANASNEITGTVTLTTNTGNASFTNNDAGGTDFGASTIAGNLTFVSEAAGGGVTQSGALDVTGAASFTTNNSGLTVDLSNASNTFGGNLAFTTNGANTDVTVFNNDAGGTTLDTTTVTGDLTVTQGDQTGSIIGQVAASVITVDGQATFINNTVDTGDVVINNTAVGGTDFGTFTGPTFDDTHVSGDLTLTSTGAVTQTGAIRVAGTFTSNAPSTTLDRSDNVFGVGFTSSDGSVYVSQVGDVDVNTAVDAVGNNITVGGSLTVIALRQGEEFTGDDIGAAAITLDQSNVFNGGLVVQSGDEATTPTNAVSNDITQSANIDVTGTATFSTPETTLAGADLTGDINLTGPGTNTLNGTVQLAGATVQLSNNTTTDLGASTTRLSTGTGDFTVTSTGAITNSGVLDILGASSFTATTDAASITLGQDNIFDGAVTITTNDGNALLNNTQATLLGNVNLDSDADNLNVGNFDITSADTITQDTGTSIEVNQLDIDVTPAGDAIFDSATNLVGTLNTANSDAGDIRLYEADGFTLASNVTAAGTVEFNTTAGGVNQTGGTISATDVLLGGAGNFTLNQANTITTLAADLTGAGTIQFTDANGLTVGTVADVTAANVVGITTTDSNVTLTVSAGNLVLDEAIDPGVGNVTLQTTTGQIVQGTNGSIDMGGGILNLNNGTGGAVGAMGTPILTSGGYTLNSDPSLAGGVFLNNQTVAGNIDINTLTPLNGNISVVNQVGNITVTNAIASTTLGTVTLDASAVLDVNDTIDGTVINLLSGTNMMVGAQVGSASTTAINVTSDGALTSDGGGTLLTPGVLTINDTGTGTIGNSPVDPLLTQAAQVVLNKTSTGASFISNNGVTVLRGTVNGDLDFRSTGGGNITIGNDALNQDLIYGANGSASTLVIISSSQLIGDGIIDANGADVGVQGTIITGNLAGNLLLLENVDVLEARGTAGGVSISHAGSDLDIGEVTTQISSNANGGILATGAINVQQAANLTVDVLGDVNTANDITIQIADSGPGGDQLFVDPLLTGVTVGTGAGGTIIIGGGVNNQGTVTASAGFTTTLDGGRPTLTLGGNQTFSGDVTFSVPGDIEITGQIVQTSATGSITLVADNEGDGEGGIIVSDDAIADPFIRSVGSLSMEAGELFFTALEGGAFTDAGVSIAVVSSSVTPAVGGNANSGSISMTSFVDNVGGALDIVIDGVVRSTSASGNITITSSDGVQMSRNITGANNVIIDHAGLLERTAVGATITTGGAATLTFLGAGNIGEDPAVLGQNRILTNAGTLDFDSSVAATKAGSDAFIEDSGGVNLIGTLTNLDLVANGTIAQTGVLDIGGPGVPGGGTATLVTNSGNITLNTSANLIDAFGVVDSAGSFSYLGNQALVLTDTVTAAAAIDINLGTAGGRDLDQLAGAAVSGSQITITTNTATFRDSWDATGTFQLTNAGLVDRPADPDPGNTAALVTANNATLLGVGSVGTNLDTGLLTSVNSLDINKANGNVYVLEQDAILVGGSSGTLGGTGTLNVSNLIDNITIGAIGINKSSGGNVHLFADNGQIIQSTTTPIRLSSDPLNPGNLLLRAIDGVGSSGAPIVTSGNYSLAALNADGFGGIYIFNQTNADTVVTIDQVDAFTPASPDALVEFHGLQNLSTNPFGGSDIVLNNLRGDIVLDDVVNPENAGQNVFLVANGTAGANDFEIQQGTILDGLDQRGVINMQGGDLYLLARSSIGDNADESATLKTSGTYDLAASVSGGAVIGGIYITNVSNAVNPSGNITISQEPAATIGVFTLPAIDGVSTPAASTEDIRIQNSGDGTGGTGNIIVDRPVTPGTGRSVALISDNGSIVGGSAAGVINMTGGGLLLAANQGIGTVANPVLTTGFYDLAVLNDDTFAAGQAAAGGNVYIQNTIASGGFGDITFTDVDDVLLAGGLGTVSGGLNSADGANNGAIHVQNDATGADAGSIIIVDTSVTTTGTTGGDAFITLIAEDDILIGDAAQAANTEVSTQNGAITLQTDNALLSAPDNFNGIRITASDVGAFTTLVSAGGAAGDVNVDSTVNSGILRVEAGDFAGATATLHSDADMTVLTNIVEVQGGGGANSVASVESLGTQTIGTALTKITNYVTVLGGTGQAADAVITSVGNQSFNIAGGTTFNTLPFTDAALALNGGTDAIDGGDAVVSQTGATGTQSISLMAGNLEVIGGDGEDADAAVTSAGTSQSLTVTDGALLVLGNQDATNGSSDALVSASNAAAVQTINVTNGGITVQGGAGPIELATIEMTGANGRQSIHLITDGDFQVLGGTGEDSDALVTSAGLDNGTEAQRIVIDAGQLLLSAGDATNNNSDANITQTNAGIASQFIQVDDGNTTGAPDGTVTLLGGAGDGEGAIISSAGTVAQTINIARGLTITGGAGAVASGAGIQATGVGVAQSVTVTDGDATLTGGTGTASRVFIDQTNAAGTQQVVVSGTDSVSDLALLGGDGLDADARVRAFGTSQQVTVSNGNLTLTANQNVTNANSDAFILANNTASTQTIDVSGTGPDGILTLQGGVGSTEIAQILGNGIQDITVDNGISVTGGSGSGSTASIDKAGDANDTQSITVDTGNFAILGGTGANAAANVTSNGVEQNITVSDGALTVQADQTDNATAGGNALVSLAANGGVAVQTIDVTNGGIIVRGGVGSPETAAIQMLDADGQQSIHLITDGDMLVEGGDGTNSTALITSAGLNGVDVAQRIAIDAGQLIVQGNQEATNAGGTAQITQTNGGAASQIIDVNGLAPTDGTVSVLGGAGTNEFAQITSAGTVAQTLTIDQGLTVTGGAGSAAFAGILSSGTGQAQSVTVFTGDALVTGGTGFNTDAFILQLDPTGTQVIDVQGGSALSNLAITGGDGQDADAYIWAHGTLQDIDVDNGNLTVTANQDAGQVTSDAFIRAENLGSTQNIDVNGVGAGTLTVQGGAGDTEIAQIFANGIQAIHVANGVSVTGGSGTGSTASIDKAGDIDDTQDITVDTGNFAILGGTGANAAASVTSNGVTQFITVSDGALTVQADQTNAGTAGGDALVSLANNAGNVAVQTIDVTNGGIIVRGGVGSPETATIQMLDADGQQSIHLITDGDMLVLGGVGEAASATINSEGLNDGLDVAQRIDIDAGRLLMDAGTVANNNSVAVISQSNTGTASQIINVLDDNGDGAPDGTVTMLGGDGDNEWALISSAGTVEQNLFIARGLTMTGGGGIDSRAAIESTGTAGADQTITVQDGNAELSGGDGERSFARIELQNATSGLQTVTLNGADSDLLLTGGFGSNADADIRTVGVDGQNITVTDGNLTLTANQDATNDISDAFIDSNNNAGTQTIIVSDGGSGKGTLTLLGGAGTNEIARISSSGVQSITVDNGISVTGGTGSGATATIRKIGDANDGQVITVNTSDFALLGGEGTNAAASVTSNGVTQQITVSDGALTVRGDQTNAGTAGGSATIVATNANADQSIDVTNGGILLRGGTGTNEIAQIQATGTGSDQQITTLAAGNIQVLGGTGTDAFGSIEAANTQTISSVAEIIVTGGSGTNNGGFAEIEALDTQSLTAATGIRVNGGSSTGSDDYAVIRGAAQQTITVTSGGLILNGNQGNSTDAAGDYNSEYEFGAGIIADTAGTQTITVNAGGLDMNGGTSAGAAAVINQVAAQQQTINVTGTTTLDGGSATGTFALIDGSGNQTITSSQVMSLTGGTANDDDFAGIVGNAVQSIIVTAGGLSLDGNDGTTTATTFGDYNFGAGIVADTAGTQTITVNAGGLDMDGGSSTNAAAVIQQAFAAQQTIDITGTTSLTGGSDTGAFALIDGSGVQTISSTQAMTLTGGTANDDDFAGIVGNNTQTITVDAGGLTLNGGQGSTNATTFGEYNFGAGIVSDAAGTQTITVSAGGLDMDGGTGTNSAAVVNQAVAAAAQTLSVTGTTTLNGGAGAGAFALIEGSGTQTLTSSQGVTLTGGTANDDDFAAIVGNNQQTITVSTGGLTLNGGQGTTNATTFGEYNFGAGIVSDTAGTQTITVNAGGLDMNGGSGVNSAAVINQAVVAEQTVDITGDTSLSGGSAAGAFAIIDGSGLQNFSSTGGVTLTGGTANDDDFATIVGNGVQNITIDSGGLVIDGNEGTTNAVTFGEYDFGAGIVADSGDPQTITVTGGLSLLGGDSAGAAAVINQAAGAQQTIDVTGTTSLTGGSAAGAFALIDGSGNQTITSSQAVTLAGGMGAGGDNFAGILGDADQTLTVAAGGLTVNAIGGSQNALTIGVEDAGAFVVSGGNQTVAVNGGNLTVNGGVRGSGLIDSGGATQTVTVAAGNASLNDGSGGNARINAAGIQTVTTSGTTNLRGDNGNESLISSDATTVLNNNGGTWTGAGNVTAANSVTINNTGPIVVDESVGFEGAVTTPLLIFSGGQATVGSTATGAGGADTRLNTDVNSIVFSGVGSKTVNISENDDVAIRGTVNTLNLITDNAGDIVNGATPFNAVNATLLTANGDIDLSGQTNAVQNFRGVVANGGSFDYLGGPSVNVFGRAVSPEVPAGASIFASNTITMDVGGNTIFLTAGNKVGAEGPGAGDGRVQSGSDQLWESDIVLLRDYEITSDGSGIPASDDIVFNGEIDGPGGLLVGSTPFFNGFIGRTEPLAYLVLNSTNSFFNVPDSSTNGPYTATMNGSFINTGTMNLSGPQGNYTFITDLGFIGAGPSVFEGGEMNLGNNTITVYTSSQDQASGSALPPAQEFNSWNGAPFRPLVPFQTATVFFKAPPPQEEIKDKKNLRKDDEGNIVVDYAGTDAGEGDADAVAGLITRDLTASSYTLVERSTEDFYYFGFEHQAPVEGLEPGQLVDEKTAGKR